MKLEENIHRIKEMMGLINETSSSEINESNFLHRVKDLFGRLLMREKYNYKPSLSFDKKFGTQISQKYEYPFGLSENKIWRIIDSCNDGNEQSCLSIRKVLEELGNYFPYPNYNELDIQKKVDILQGMVSHFNYEDIVSFSIDDKKGYNTENRNEIDELGKKLNYDLEWIPSIQTIQKIKDQLNLS